MAAQQIVTMPVTVRSTILAAIENRRRLQVTFRGQSRTVEPYLVFATKARQEVLHSWQTAGDWTHSPPPDWCDMKLVDISAATALAEHYTQPNEGYNPESPRFHRVVICTPQGPTAKAPR